jgi:hypothetical protein
VPLFQFQIILPSLRYPATLEEEGLRFEVLLLYDEGDEKIEVTFIEVLKNHKNDSDLMALYGAC